MICDFPWDDSYRVSSLEHVMTPALVLYPEIIASNVSRTIDLLDGNPDRWRAHIKTAKLADTLRRLLDHGVRNFKCATTLELLTACENGANDVLVAYPVMGANAQRVREIADRFRQVRISVLAENELQIRQWIGSPVGIFLDINPGMNRTGIEQRNNSEVLELIRAIHRDKLEFRG
jgi:D-serine deaminase-like pyridoxal phosphate-dependent protein